MLKAIALLADDSVMKSTTVRDRSDPRAGLSPCARRRENRIRVLIPMQIIYRGLSHRISQGGICTDLSEAGIGFRTQIDLYVGEIVEVEFRDQASAPFRFTVRLLYKMGDRYGAYFVSPEFSSS